MSWKRVLTGDLATIIIGSIVAVVLLWRIPDSAPEHVGWGVAAGLVIGGLRVQAIRSLGDEVRFVAFQDSLRKSFWGRAANAVLLATIALMVVLTLLRPMQEHRYRIWLGLLVAHVVKVMILAYPRYRLAYLAEAKARAGRSGRSGVPSVEHDHQRSE